MRPLPSSKGWMHSKYRWAIPALVKAGSDSSQPGPVRRNQVMNRAISDGMRDDGGASKCTLGSYIVWETTCIGSAPVRYRPTSFKSRLPLITMWCQRNSISSESGSIKDRYRSTIISAIPRSAGRTRRSSAASPSCLRMEDCTLARSRNSPSISEVVTASVLIASIVSCSRSSFPRWRTVPTNMPPPTRNCFSAASKRARSQRKEGQSGCCQFQAMSDRRPPYRSYYDIL